jgi:hypothetical protein
VYPTNLIERAYQLARTGDFAKVEHIERKLTREGYTAVADHLSGRMLRRELNDMMRAARREKAEPA